MVNRLRALDSKLRSLRTSVFIVVMTLLSVAIVLPFLPILYSLEAITGPTAGPSISDKPLIYQFVGGVLLAPVIETLIFQAAPILLLKKYSSLKPGAIILVSSLFFAVAHHYSISYVLFAFLVGVFLAYSYVLYLKKEASAFWVVTAIHSLRNLFAMVFINVS